MWVWKSGRKIDLASGGIVEPIWFLWNIIISILLHAYSATVRLLHSWAVYRETMKNEILKGGWWNFWEWWNFSKKNQISPPNIGGGVFGGGLGPKSPPKWQLERKMRQAQLSQISEGTCSYALPCTLDGLLQPVLQNSASSSCCCAFSSNFCVAMAEQLCSNPWGTALFKAKFGITPQKWAKNDQILGWGHLMAQINPPPGSRRFPMKPRFQRG